jgi:hypothetical protein
MQDYHGGSKMRRTVVVLIAVLMLICLAACVHADSVVMPSISFALYSPSQTGAALHTNPQSGLQPLMVKADGSPMIPTLRAHAFKCPEPSGIVSLLCGVACIASLVYRRRA